MPIMVHTDALGSIIGACLIFVFTLYILLYTKTRHTPLLSLDFFLLQLSLFVFLTGYSVYVSSTLAETVLLWTRICYVGICLAPGFGYRFYESLTDRKHGSFSSGLTILSLILAALMFLPGDFIFTGQLNPRKTHSSVIKGPLYPWLLILTFSLLLFVAIKTALFIMNRKKRKSCYRPIVFGLLFLLLFSVIEGIFVSWLSLLEPHYWLGTTSLAISLALYTSCIAREHNEELEFLRKEKERIYHNLIHDKLTGLYTRGYLYESIYQISNQIQRSNHECSLLFIDVDNFKKLNDDLGHMEGDRLLKALGDCLSKRTRNYDIPARIGGDEFVILLPDSSSSSAEKVAKHIGKLFRDLIAESYPDWPYRDQLSLSIGIVSREDWAGSPEQLVMLADKAMYQSKRSGKDRITHYRGSIL